MPKGQLNYNESSIKTFEQIITPTWDKEISDIDISRDQIQDEIHGDDWFKLVMDPCLNPNVRPSTFPCSAFSWSSLGVDPVGRCVVAVVSSHGFVSLHSRGTTKNSWTEVLSLKSLWEDTVMEQNFQLVNDPIHHSTLMESISYRRHILNMVSTEFSKTYSSKPNGCHTFLFTGLRSGHVVLWTVKCPLLSQEDISLALVCKTGNSSVKVMRWCDVGHNKGFLVCGFSNGSVTACYMENADDLDQMILSSAVSLWSEEDSIPISAIKWCLQERVLLIAKGQFLIAFKFDDDFLHCPKSFCRKASKPKIRHRHVGTELPITGIDISKETAWVTTGDGKMYSLSRANISSDQDLELAEIALDPGAIRSKHVFSWQTHGLTLTTNFTYMLVVLSPRSVYDHLAERQPLKIHFVLLNSAETLQQTGDGSDTDNPLVDVLVNLQATFFYRDPSAPSPDLTLEENQNLEQVPRMRLRIARYCCLLRNVMFDPSAGANADVQKQRSDNTKLQVDIERLLIFDYFVEKLEGRSQWHDLSPKAAIFVGLLKSLIQNNPCLRQRHTKFCSELDGQLYSSPAQEKCCICDSAIPFTNISSNACANGHSFQRCCQTLMLCQSIKYRSCGFCGSLAVSFEKYDPLLSLLLTDRCPFCNHFLCKSL